MSNYLAFAKRHRVNHIVIEPGVRTARVIMQTILFDAMSQVPFAKDYYPIETLGFKRPHPAFREGIQIW